MSERKKTWCSYHGETACTCPVGQCWAENNRGMLDNLNTLLDYGLSLEEIAGDMKDNPDE